MDVAVVLAWEQARAQLIPLAPKLVEIIDQISPNKRFDFVKVSYPYGSQVMRRGCFDLSRIHNPIIRQKLKYSDSANPMMIVLRHCFELFAPQNDRIIPYYIVKPGQLFGIWQILNKTTPGRHSYFPYAIWDMTAGARSVFMLPKISEKSAHKKLQSDFQISVDKPVHFKDHWQVFRALSQSAQFEDTWSAEALFFSSDWFENLDDPAFKYLKLYLYECIWQQSELWRSQTFWDLTFSRIHAKRNMTSSPYHMDVARHIFAIAAGVLPGFKPVTDDQMGPFATIKSIYEEHYGSAEWAPLMMQPAMFSFYEKTESVYYSLRYPSAIRLAVKPSERDSIISDTYLIARLIDKYKAELANNEYEIKESTLNDIPSNVNFTYFHTKQNDYRCVGLSDAILSQDPRFLSQIDHENKFPKTSAFFTGCIKISNIGTD